MSLDGCIDDANALPLKLSNTQDFEHVDEVRAHCDAILVGAGTIRKDNPKLLVKSEARQQERVARGLPLQPIKVTLTRSGNLDPRAHFFTMGEGKSIVYCTTTVASALQKSVGLKAEIIALGKDDIDPTSIINDLAARGVRTLLIEAGSTIATLFLNAGLVDELQVSIAPFFVGNALAPRIVNTALSLYSKDRPMKLKNVETFTDVVMLTYAPQ
mgnify:CR=1 FL=1